jgi:hypothetical protein
MPPEINLGFKDEKSCQQEYRNENPYGKILVTNRLTIIEYTNDHQDQGKD